jgi:WD40 repeat protein
MQVLSIGKKKRFYAIAFSPDCRDLATVSGDGFLRVWDLGSGEERQQIAVEETSCGYDIAYLDPDRLIFAGIELRWWDIPANGWNLIAPGMRWNRQLCLSPDRRLLAETDQTSSTDWSNPGLKVRDTETWAEMIAVPDTINTTGGVAFSPDGKWLATGHIIHVGHKQRYFGIIPGGYAVNAYDYIVHLREMPTGRIVHSSDGWQQGIGHLAFSPDSRFLAGTAGPRLRIWDVEEDCEVLMHKRGTKHFQGLSFTADGRYLATVSNDETVRIWETRAWQEYTTFTWQIGRLLNVAFAPDGLCAAAGSDQGKVVIWDMEE